MNKNIKRVIALVLAVGTVSTAGPATSYNLLTTKAYASNINADPVTGLTLQDRSGKFLKFYTDISCTTEASVSFTDGGVYNTTTTSASVKITDIIGPEDDEVRIFRGNDTGSNDDYEINDTIELTDRITKLKVKVYEDDYDDKDCDRGDYNKYLIQVKYTGDLDDLDDDDDDDDDDDNDDDYLDALYLYDDDRDEIQLYEDNDYDDKLDNDDLDDEDEGETYYAKSSSNVVSIETRGPDDDYVRVFKSTNDSSEAIETGDDISITGDRTLTVRIYEDEPDDDIEYEDDDDVIGEYKIKLEYTGNGSSSGQEPNGPIVYIKPNQWVQINGYWQYNDSLGNPLRNKWHYDENYGKWYYLKSDGIMAVNYWSLYGDKWYYLGNDGAMLENCWVLYGGKWYYLGNGGAMLTNCWVLTNGRYYYVDSNGAWIR